MRNEILRAPTPGQGGQSMKSCAESAAITFHPVSFSMLRFSVAINRGFRCPKAKRQKTFVVAVLL